MEAGPFGVLDIPRTDSSVEACSVGGDSPAGIGGESQIVTGCGVITISLLAFVGVVVASSATLFAFSATWSGFCMISSATSVTGCAFVVALFAFSVIFVRAGDLGLHVMLEAEFLDS